MKTLSLLSLLIVCGCAAPHRTSVIYGDNYDSRNNITTITMLPYGGVKLPGKWIKTRESSISNQYFFIGPDSTIFAVALNPWNKYEFVNSQTTHQNFVKQFYEWDANYLKQQHNGEIRIIKEDKTKNFILWNIKNSQGLNDYFLFGLKGQIAYNLYVGSDTWSELSTIEWLEKIYE